MFRVNHRLYTIKKLSNIICIKN